MNTTLLLVCIGLILYIGANIRLWRRLNRGEKGRSHGQQRPGQQR